VNRAQNSVILPITKASLVQITPHAAGITSPR
jgi:hypothetical protein